MSETRLYFVLDRSGSMAGLEDETIGGFNSLIEKQKREDGTALITTVLFDNNIELLHDHVDLKAIPPMTREQYYVRGMTAMLDAIGYTIGLADSKGEGKVLFVITTDGRENASREYNRYGIKQLIEDRRKKGWDFLFLGANIDAENEGDSIGMGAGRSVRYHSDKQGTKKNYEVLSKAISKVRMSSKCTTDALDEIGDWSSEIKEDFQKR